MAVAALRGGLLSLLGAGLGPTLEVEAAALGQACPLMGSAPSTGRPLDRSTVRPPGMGPHRPGLPEQAHAFTPLQAVCNSPRPCQHVRRP